MKFIVSPPPKENQKSQKIAENNQRCTQLRIASYRSELKEKGTLGRAERE